MDTPAAVMMALGFLFLGLLAGALVGAWLMWRRLASSGSGHQTEAESLRRELTRVQTELASARTESRVLTNERAADHARRTAREREESAVLQALAPVGERLQVLQKQVGLLERDRVEQYGQLSEQLKTAAATDTALLVNTRSLVETLKSTSARGHWGEVQLRRVVEAAGMLNHTDFTEQAHLVGAEDQRLRPDLVVHLPGGKSLAVDAKVPLAALLQAHDLVGDSSAEAAQRRGALYREHAQAVRAHVDTLSSKAYWEALAHSPELVVCFLPSESALAAALDADPALLDHAFARNVALVSPVSLLATLKSVAYTWRQDTLAEHAQTLFETSHQLYQRLGTLGTHLTKLGSSLKTSVEKYNALLGTLESRVLPSARRIGELDPTARGSLEMPSPVEATPRVLSASELLETTEPDALDQDPRGPMP